MEVDELSKQGQLWVWIHPSAFESTKAMIQDTIAKANKADLVNVKDMENSLVMFDFTGPRSTALLKAVLQLCQSDAASPYQEAHRVHTAPPSLYGRGFVTVNSIEGQLLTNIAFICLFNVRRGRRYVTCGRRLHSPQALFLVSSSKILGSRTFEKCDCYISHHWTAGQWPREK